MSDDSMLELFRQEAETQIAILTQELLILEANPQSEDALEALMRAAHSIKGAARIVSLDAVTTLAHWMEDCFVAAQSQIITLGSDQIDVLLQSVDLLQALSQVMAVDLLEWLAQTTGEFESCYEAIAALLPPDFRDPRSKSLVPADQNSALSQSERQEIATAETSAIPTDRVVRVTAENLNRIMGLAGESLVEANWLQPFADSFTALKSRQLELARLLETVHTTLANTPINSESQQVLIQLDVKHKNVGKCSPIAWVNWNYMLVAQPT